MSKCCYYCEREFGSITYHGVALIKTRDHVIPLSAGGRVRGDNVVPCCHYCNKLKSVMLPVEFAGFLSSMLSNKKGTKIHPDQLRIMIKNVSLLIDKIEANHYDFFKKPLVKVVSHASKESIIALQKVDCNCNDCIHMVRDLDKYRKSDGLFTNEKNQVTSPSHRINYGKCKKFDKDVSFIPGTCQLDTQICFEHRRIG